MELTSDERLAQLVAGVTSLDELTLILERLLGGDFAVSQDGRLMRIRAIVGRVNGLRILIHPNDHLPPHFHVEGGNVDASFTIEDCALIGGDVRSRELGLVRLFHRHARPLLRERWEELRPTDPAHARRADR